MGFTEVKDCAGMIKVGDRFEMGVVTRITYPYVNQDINGIYVQSDYGGTSYYQLPGHLLVNYFRKDREITKGSRVRYSNNDPRANSPKTWYEGEVLYVYKDRAWVQWLGGGKGDALMALNTLELMD